jgi:DNA polymerase
MVEQMAKDPTLRPVAANSNFDQAWEEKYWPAFQNPWYCILDHGAFCQYPRNLASLSGVVTGEKVDKSIRDEMLGKRYEDLSPADKEKVEKYCLNDCFKTAEVLSKLPPMSSFEEKVAAHTRLINRRGVYINTDLVAGDKTRLEKMRFDALKALPWHQDAPPLSFQALVRYCNAKGLPVPKSLAKTDEETTDLMTDNAELSAVIGFMRRFRRANTMLKKIETLQERVTSEHILPLDILFCGAPHTRRWSSKGFNIQNLDKEPLITAPGEDVWTRRWICPRPGHIFLIFDFAQIEPRCLNWLCGNEDMMEALRHGFSYYEAYVTAAKQAARVGWSGQAGTLKKEVGVTKYTKIKNESLGCGYGMGAAKYTTYASVTPAEAKAVVEGFRKGNPQVVNFWRRLDNLIATAARDKSRHLALDMPTGDILQHFSIRTSRGGYESFTTKGDYGHQSHQPRLWGGTLTENVTQRMARDVMANAILKLEDAGLRVAFHVHDEVVLEIPLDSKDAAKETAERILIQPPEWAPDLPLGVEGGFEECYTK